jgi:hypothetical protein
MTNLLNSRGQSYINLENELGYQFDPFKFCDDHSKLNYGTRLGADHGRSTIIRGSFQVSCSMMLFSYFGLTTFQGSKVGMTINTMTFIY